MIYSKLIDKEEMSADLETFSHIRNELACIGTVKLLTLENCDRLYPLIRCVKTEHGRQLVDNYLVCIKKLPNTAESVNHLHGRQKENIFEMKPIPFNSHKDLAPVVFDTTTCRLAKELKQLRIPWQPHVGCFVWDPDEHIKAGSPFPLRIYFILSLQRFIDILGSIEAIAEKLVWLPTWHQARLLCQQLGVPDSAVANIWQNQTPPSAGNELRQIDELLIAALKE